MADETPRTTLAGHEPSSFVVQLQPGDDGRELRGRVEHLATGREAHFGSADELLRLLRTLGRPIGNSGNATD